MFVGVVVCVDNHTAMLNATRSVFFISRRSVFRATFRCAAVLPYIYLLFIIILTFCLRSTLLARRYNHSGTSVYIGIHCNYQIQSPASSCAQKADPKAICYCSDSQSQNKMMIHRLCPFYTKMVLSQFMTLLILEQSFQVHRVHLCGLYIYVYYIHCNFLPVCVV